MKREEIKPRKIEILSLSLAGLLFALLILAVLIFPLQQGIVGEVTKQTKGSVKGVEVKIPLGAATDTSSLGYYPNKVILVIGINNTIRWVNDDNAPHTVTSVDKVFDSGNLAGGKEWSFTFTSPGEYRYTCLYHPWMKGEVIVKSG